MVPARLCRGRRGQRELQPEGPSPTMAGGTPPEAWQAVACRFHTHTQDALSRRELTQTPDPILLCMVCVLTSFVSRRGGAEKLTFEARIFAPTGCLLRAKFFVEATGNDPIRSAEFIMQKCCHCHRQIVDRSVNKLHKLLDTAALALRDAGRRPGGLRLEHIYYKQVSSQV